MSFRTIIFYSCLFVVSGRRCGGTFRVGTQPVYIEPCPSSFSSCPGREWIAKSVGRGGIGSGIVDPNLGSSPPHATHWHYLSCPLSSPHISLFFLVVTFLLVYFTQPREALYRLTVPRTQLSCFLCIHYPGPPPAAGSSS